MDDHPRILQQRIESAPVGRRDRQHLEGRFDEHQDQKEKLGDDEDREGASGELVATVQQKQPENGAEKGPEQEGSLLPRPE